MPFPNPDTQFQSGVSGNPTGAKPGTKHISTHIQKLMEDPNFEARVLDAKEGLKDYKGAPVTAIIQVAIAKAVNGDEKAREWLAKYGWTQKLQLGNDPDNPLTDAKGMNKEELEDAVRDILGSAAESGRAIRPSSESPQSTD